LGKFIGVSVPTQRAIAEKYGDLELDEIENPELFRS
jgi:hypothetical protein